MINPIKAIGLTLWIACGAASSGTADAYLKTSQSGPYAACPAQYEFRNNTTCWTTPKGQYIHFTTVACNNGSCSTTLYEPLVDFNYAPGRAPATYITYCSPYNKYGLGSCAC